MSVIDEIAAERKRQIEAEGWTPEHDDQHSDRALARAAACYAVSSIDLKITAPESAERGWWILRAWPWSLDWWKPSTRRRDLIKAAALIVAEIERLDRKQAAEKVAA